MSPAVAIKQEFSPGHNALAIPYLPLRRRAAATTRTGEVTMAEGPDPIRVTDTGVECFTSYPRGLVPVGEAGRKAAESVSLLGNPGERAVHVAPGAPATAQPVDEPRRPATPRFGFTTPDESTMTGSISIVPRNAETADSDPARLTVPPLAAADSAADSAADAATDQVHPKETP